MASSTKWIDNGVLGQETLMNIPIALTNTGVNDLSLLTIEPPLSHIIFGDYTKWCSNLLFFPFKTTLNSNMKYLKVGGAETDVGCYNLNLYYSYGFTLGEYKYERLYNDFRDFEPYTKLQIYLPFYQFVDIPVADVIDKYIQFRLRVDYMTGQAVYIIGVSDTSIESPNKPFYIGTDDTYTRIIGTYTFQIGASIPLGQTGMADAIRNISLAGLKMASGVVATGVTSAMGGYESKTTTNTIKTTSKALSKGGMKPTSQVETSSTRIYDNTNYAMQQNISTAFQGGLEALQNIQLSAHTGNASNILVDCQGSKSIKIVRKLAKVVDISDDYGHLYGFPLGKVKTLKDVTGYTEINSFHLEGVGLGTATQKEIMSIKQILYKGIIL